MNDVIGSFEYTMRRTDSYVADTDGWYATLGYRLGAFTPYATVSEVKRKDSNVNNTIPALTPQLAVLKATVDAVVADQNISQKSVGLGMRWDAMRNVAVKAQFDRVKPTGVGLFNAPKPGFGGKNVNVYSLSVDTVF
jgi:hypothetical protein